MSDIDSIYYEGINDEIQCYEQFFVRYWDIYTNTSEKFGPFESIVDAVEAAKERINCGTRFSSPDFPMPTEEELLEDPDLYVPFSADIYQVITSEQVIMNVNNGKTFYEWDVDNA